MRIRLNPLQVTGVDFDFNMQTEYLRSARVGNHQLVWDFGLWASSG